MRSSPRQARRPGSGSRLLALVGSLVLVAGLLPVVAVAPALASHTPAPASVTIAGSLQGELGCSADWQPECASTHLSYDATDEVWQATFAVPVAAAPYEYKAALNDAWTENYGANAAFNGPNLSLTVGDANATKFYYSHDSHWVTSNRNAAIATAAGSFQSEIGCPGDWAPDCLRSWLQDPDGDDVYTFVSNEIPAGDYETKAALNEAWDTSYPAANVAFSVATGDVVTITYTAATNAVTATSEPPPAPDTTVALVGTVQSELGCPGDWQPECANTELTLGADGAWRGTFTVPAGTWEYKVALNDTWDVNYGAGAVLNGGNIALTLAAEASVRFYFDGTTHWVTSNRNATIATAAGSFQSEIGCPGDWAPDCLRSWLQDIDGDGTYTFVTDDIPTGDYAAKVTLDEAWTTSYPAADVPFSVTTGDTVTFTYVAATNVVTVDVGDEPPDPEDEALARHSLREDLTDEVFYFVLPDRFDDGDGTNDAGGLTGDRLATGLDPTDKGFYHGGDVAGLLDRLDYIESLGTTAVWMAPIFKNRPVQGSGADASAGYHGYWITDFTQIDPHFGTNAELEAFVDAAHARGIKVFFDIITNHTADVIDYAEGTHAYRNKDTYPYVDADGNEFDDRDYAGTDTFPAMTVDGFPYDPVFPTPADATVKAPAWLNDRTMYHNRGDSTFVGENSEYGDFFGLDDLFTERHEVVDGMIDIYETWVTDVGIDGFRIDTAKHVNIEFWQKFSPALQAHAAAAGNDDFFMFGEVFDGNPAFMSRYTTEGELQATLDFGFQGRATNFAAFSAPTDELRDLFADDDYYTDADSNAYSLPTFLGNHDIGRIGRFIAQANAGADDAELLARDKLAHTLMYLVRGMPVVYYGDEQGFTGDGGDRDARQDMMPSQVTSYNDDDLIGTTATTAVANFDETHPLYTFLGDLADLKAAHPALRSGAQVQRYSTSAAGIFAFSRIDAEEGIEYVVALNNAETAKTQSIQTYSADTAFSAVWPAGATGLTSNGSGQLSITVPPLSAIVLRADAALAADSTAPTVTIVSPADGSTVAGRVAVGATLSDPEFAEVTFAVKVGDATEWTVVGTDDNAPYRVFYDTAGLAADTQLTFKAVVRDAFGNLDSDTGTAVVGAVGPPPGGGGTPDYAVVHYLRPAGDYDGWGFHFWGDIDQTVEWTSPVPLAGEDAYGPFAWVKLLPDASEVGFIPHKGDEKDPGPDRFFNPTQNPEIWLKQGDLTVYPSQAAAQGYATIHYHRPDDVYDGWGLHLWGDAIDPSEATEWATPKAPTGSDDYGPYWTVQLADPTQPLNFIIHKGDEKDPGPDQSFTPAEEPAVWIQSGDTTIHPTLGSAEDFAVIHYHRPDGDYGDATSTNYNDFWGLHTWAGHLDPDPEWTSPIKPAGTDRFGVFFKLDLDPDATELAYILHRGDTKDPGPDQFLDLVNIGHEVWYLSGHTDADNMAKYLLPVQAGSGSSADLSRQKAHWVTENTIAWNIDPVPGGEYALHFAPDGGLAVVGGALTGGTTIPLARVAAGLSAELQEKWPHLATYQAFRIAAGDLDQVPDALKSQLAVSATNADGTLVDATGLQIPGVLDDVYPYTGELGVSWAGGIPTIRVWAPTAKSVGLQRYADATTATSATHAMTRDDATGVWSVTGTAAWKNQFYLYDVEVFAPSTGQVEHNLVTDPYSVALARNSTRTQIVDLSDAALRPAGWTGYTKPAIGAPEGISLYELHVRDFSINDSTVPAAERGTYQAFTRTASDGMQHLEALADAGLTHVHLLPVFDIATVDEDRSTHLTPPCNLASFPRDSAQQQACIAQVRAQDGFNWGYDPWHYTTPEGSYAINPQGAARTTEFRAMVKSLNDAGLRVVMDVVYNHTNAAGQAEKSVLDRIVPGYYHRLLEDGTLANSTCCANTATEHAMMGKLMVEFDRDLGARLQSRWLPLRPHGPSLEGQPARGPRRPGCAHAGQGRRRWLEDLPLRRGLELWRGRERRALRPGHAAQHGRDRHRHLQRPAARRRPWRRPLRWRPPRQPGLRQRPLHGSERRQHDDPGGAAPEAPAPPGPDQGGPDGQPPGLRVRRPDRRHSDRRGRRLQRRPGGLHQ